MIMATGDESNLKFSDMIQYHELNYSTILECQAKTLNIFTKPISDSQFAVFGDYKLTVFYRKIFVGEDKIYGSTSFTRNICEIIPFHVSVATNTQAVLTLQPSCIFRYEKYDRSNAFWEINVQGEIHISNFSSHSTKDMNTIKPDQSSPESMESETSGADVWQFEGNEDISVEQMMDMDLESLKNMKK